MSERVDLVNPFPGPQPYRSCDRDRFYGRDAVARRLTSTILAHRCVALFGPSGAGKSSVMQAAVIPELDENFDFRHVAIDGWPSEDEPVAWLLERLYAQLKLSPPAGDLGLFESVEWTVKQAFRRSERPILIYLDQIEQLLLPHRASAGVDDFFDWLDSFAERPIRGLHLVLAMREDYLGRFRDRAQGRHRLLENGFRLGPLTVGEIVGAVCRAAGDGMPAQTWSEASMRTLMLQVRTPGSPESDSAEIQTAFAQIVCRALFVERAVRGELVTADADEVEAEPILHRYLESTLEGLGVLRGAAERLMEEHLVAADGTRSLLTEEAARASGLCSIEELATILGDLERAAILRAEQHRGTRYFEIGHDWLAKKVFDRKAERIARAAELARQEEMEAQARAAEEQLAAARADTRRARKVVAIVTALGLAALTLGVFAWTQRQYARDEADRARAAEREAISARDRAKQASEEAEAARLRAESARLAARRAAEEALAQKEIAESERLAAKRSEDKAKVALVGQRRATQEAERQRSAALTNLARAEDESRRARDANHLAVALSTLEDDPTVALAILREIEDPAGTRGWTPATVEALQQPASQAIMRGHEGYVVDATFRPDGAVVATASHDQSVVLARVAGDGPPRRLTGHGAQVLDVAFSPDGRRLASASADGTVRLWAAGGDASPRVLTGQGGAVEALAFSPDGTALATASRDGVVRVYRGDGEGRPRLLRGHESAVRAVSFSPDGARLVTTSDDGTARVWPLGAARTSASTVLRGHEGTVYSASFSPDGGRVVTAGDDRSVRVWSMGDDEHGAEIEADELLMGHTDAVYTAEFDPKGSRVVTASRDRSARLWTLRPGREAEVRVLAGHRDKVLTACFAPGGAVIATASRDGTARLWPASGGEARVLRGHSGPVVAVEFTRDGRQLVTAAEDGTARVWHVADRHSERVLRGHRGAVNSAVYADGDRIITAGAERSVRIWSLAGSTPRTRATVEDAGGDLLLAVQGLEGRLLTGTSDGKVRSWTLADAGGGKRSVQPHRTVDLGLRGRPSFIQVSPDGRHVVSATTDVAWVIALDGEGRVALRGHRGKVLNAAFSSDGRQIITTSDDRTARIWRADGQGDAVVLRGHEGSVYHAAFSHDDASVVTASWDRTARIFAADGRPQRVLTGHEKIVRTAAFSPDGKRVVTASDDGTARIWPSDGVGDVVALYGHEGPVLSAAFSPDGRHVVTASSDRTTRVWEADFDNPGLLRAKIEETTTVCLVPEQRVDLLAELPEEAKQRYLACETSHGR